MRFLNLSAPLLQETIGFEPSSCRSFVCLLIKNQARNEVEGGSNTKNVRMQTTNTYPQGKIKRMKGTILWRENRTFKPLSMAKQ